MQKRFIVGTALSIALVFAILFYSRSLSPSIQLTLQHGRSAFEAGEYDVALEIATQLLASAHDNGRETPEISGALMLAGESLTKQGRYAEAIEFYVQVPESSTDAAIANWAAGEIYLHIGQSTQAFNAIAKSLRIDPTLEPAHARMIELSNMFGRRRESFPSLMFMLTSNRLTLERLLFIGNLDKETVSREQLESFLARSPNDYLPYLGLARLAARDGELEIAEDFLRKLIAQQSGIVEAHVQLGFVLLQKTPEQLAVWNRSLPISAEGNADAWFLRGQWQLVEGKKDEAIRCFAESIRRDPNHIQSHQSIAQALTSQGAFVQANRFAEKSQQLQKLNIALDRIYQSQSATDLMHETAELLVDLGRLWEALGWCNLAYQLEPQLAWPREVGARVQAEAFTPESPHTLEDANLVSDAGWLESYPLPDFTDRSFVQLGDSTTPSYVSGKLAFRDIAAEVGLSFEFDNHKQAVHEGHRMYQTTGGGIGVIDYDLNGRPDLFFTQGGNFPIDSSSDSHQDQLFRNQPGPHGPTFQNVTRQAGFSDHQFGQGVSIGDVNADGFDDIYVCNIGANQLWLNRGDGTFEDATDRIPPAEDWTCSAMIADLDFNGLPEIYEANYLAGRDVYTKMCQIGNLPRSCSPLDFSPARDRLLTIEPTGDIREVVTSNIPSSNSFGIVAFLMADSRFPSTFVSVDQQANIFATVSAASTDTASFALSEAAILKGLAYDKLGQAQACMGIAAGDANNNGKVDLYVTNFHLEYNTLYIQRDGQFRDETAASGTIAATRPQLGFGCQFVDVQLDGINDLIVLNGHIDDHSHMNIPEEMLPQLFIGIGNGRYRLADAKDNMTPDDFLMQRGIGRALALADIDCDGMIDFVCGQLEHATTKLVRNECEPIGSATWLSLHLVGTESSRNAFFTTATLATGDYESTLQLIAGGGYQATNQRLLHFAIPSSAIDNMQESDGAISLMISWPSGNTDTYRDLSPTTRYVAVEGQGINEINSCH